MRLFDVLGPVMTGPSSSHTAGAVRIGSTDPTDIAEALRNDGGYNGVSGTITFDEKGKLTGRAPRIMVSQNGAFTFMEE